MDGLLGVAGMIITSDGLEWIGSFPHSPKFPTFSTSKITVTSGFRDTYDTFLRPHVFHLRSAPWSLKPNIPRGCVSKYVTLW